MAGVRFADTNTGRSAVLPAHLPQDLCASGGPWASVRDGPGHSESMDSCPTAGAAGGAAHPRRCPRSLTALAQRLGVSEADAATVVAPLAEELTPMATVPAATPASPLVPMTGPSGASSAPKTLLHRRNGSRTRCLRIMFRDFPQAV